MSRLFHRQCQLVLACWLWWLCAATVFALDPTKAITQYVHDVWTDQNGLPQNTIGGIGQMHDGYLWFGTIRGLVRFDGIRFTVFNSTNTDAFVYDNIYTLFVDREGTLWVGPDGGGLVRYRSGEFKRYAEPEGFTSDGIRAIRQDRAGNIWIAARDLYRFKDGKFTHWGVNEGLLHSSASSILEDKAGRLWIGTAKGLDLFQDGKFTHYSTEQGLASGRVWAIHEDRQGNLWIGSAEGMAWNPVNRGGLSLFKDGKFKVYSTQNGLPHNGVNAIAEDQEGNLWIATSGGLCRYSEGRFTSSPPKDFLPENNITSLFVDREGSLWFGTLMGGLNRLRDGKFTTLTKADGLPSEAITSVYEGQAGNLWIGTRDQGLVRLRNNQLTTYSLRQGLADNFVNLVCEEAADSLLVTTEHGLSRIRGEQVRSFANNDGSLGGNRIYCITKDAAGQTFLGTGSGVYKFKDDRFTPVPELKGNTEVSLIKPSRSGGLWVASASGLILYRDGKTSYYTTSPVNSFYEDAAGTLWVGVDSSGLIRLKDGQSTAYTTKAGMPNSQIITIQEDQNKDMWISGIGGIVRIAKQELEDYATGKIKAIAPIRYDRSDGLKSAESYYSCKTKDGRLLFATMKGVAMLDPANIHSNKLPPPVVIEQAIADGSSFSLAQPQQLAAGTQNLEFQYAGLSLVAAEKNQYKYQLVGYDKTWIDVGNRRTAYYTNLPPGNYTFRVIASNNDGVWNETGAAYSFYLKPYFWQTWWFYGLCIGGIGLAGFGLNNLRTKRVMAREREKTQLKIAELRLEKTQMQAQAIEAENNRKTQELEEARRLQLSMLPKGNVKLERLEITGAMRTATEVGGDYYDFLPLPDGRYCVVIGDATGHGMSAGLIVGMVKMGLTSRLQAQPQLQPMIEDLNTALKQSLAHRGVGMCLGATIIDPKTLAVELCSNGMPYPYHFTKGELRAIELKAQPLGFLKRVNVPTATLQLQAGDVLIWVSDGFEERMNARGDVWGTEQVAAALTEICAHETSGAAIARALIAACDRVSDGRNNDDDMTIVVIKAS